MLGMSILFCYITLALYDHSERALFFDNEVRVLLVIPPVGKNLKVVRSILCMAILNAQRQFKITHNKVHKKILWNGVA